MTSITDREARATQDERIESLIVRPLAEFAGKRAEDILLAFVAGSYARGTHNPANPNINIYFLAARDRAADVRMALGGLFREIDRSLAEFGWVLALDCHPFTVASHRRAGEGETLVTLTSKVFEKRSPRWSLPPTIGLGWLVKYRVLAGSEDELRALDLVPATDVEWFQGLHEALSRYRNILDHLPWALPWHEDPSLLAEESLRYAEEALRDALPVALTQDELRRGLQFAVYHQWKGGAREFLQERFGDRGAWMDDAVGGLKQEFDRKHRWNAAEAEKAWRTALTVWEIVWEKFCARAAEERPADAVWLCRTNAFS